jgi:hypothetical protein
MLPLYATLVAGSAGVTTLAEAWSVGLVTEMYKVAGRRNTYILCAWRSTLICMRSLQTRPLTGVIISSNPSCIVCI